MKTKTPSLSLLLSLSFAACAAGQAPPVYQAPAPAQPAPQAAAPAPPPAAPPKRSAAELEKLVAPIALYPDPLIATMLPASVYPLEIVQAARFVANTNNLAKLDEQPWDDSVKAVARVPDAIKKMNEDIAWTMELGDAFLAQDKDILDAIQSMRTKAQKAGTLQTTPQQIVVVTNMIIEKTVEQQVVVVTNTVVQIQPTSSTVVYVPAYNPYTVYYPPPAYVYNPYAPLVTFAAGVAVGAIIANNNCNWYGGGCYHGSGDVNINVNNNYNQNNINNINNKSGNNAQAKNTSAQQKWQPDPSRQAKSGSPTAANSARSAEARGYGSGSAKPSTANAGARPSTGAAGGTAGARPSTGTAGAGSAGARPSTGTAGGSAGTRPSTGTPSASRPTTSPSTASRPSPSPSASQSRSSASASRPSPSSSGSAFSGSSSGASARSSSSRGSASRGGGGGGRGGGGGGRR